MTFTNILNDLILNRNFIRTSWSSRKLQEELNMQVVFLLGRSPKWSKKGASLIRAEMDRYNDIVEAGAGLNPEIFVDYHRRWSWMFLFAFFFCLDYTFHQTSSMATAT